MRGLEVDFGGIGGGGGDLRFLGEMSGGVLGVEEVKPLLRQPPAAPMVSTESMHPSDPTIAGDEDCKNAKKNN